MPIFCSPKSTRLPTILKACGLILMQMEVPVETVYHTIAFAAENGIETILNPAPAAADLDPELIRQVTFLVPNESELLRSSPACRPARTMRSLPFLPAQCARHPHRHHAFGEPRRTHDYRQRTSIPPVKVTPKDTTGAGDAFIGSFSFASTGTGDVEARFARPPFMRPIPSPGRARRKPMPARKNSKRLPSRPFDRTCLIALERN